MEYSPKERGIWDYYRLVYLVIPLWSQRLLSDFKVTRLRGHSRDAFRRGGAGLPLPPPPLFFLFLSTFFLCYLLLLVVCVCVCVCVCVSCLTLSRLRSSMGSRSFW